MDRDLRTLLDITSVTPKLCTTEAMPLTHEGLSSLHPLPQVAFNRGRFEGLPHKPTIAAKYVAIVATSRRLSFPACNGTDASLTFPSFVFRWARPVDSFEFA